MLEFQWLWGFLWGLDWGVGGVVGWLELGLVRWEWVEALGLLGRAWVISLPKFFLGKYFHFWKLPPLFCIKNRDNVYYPVFLTCYLVRKINIKYAVICIVSVCRSVKMLSQNQRF